MPSKINRENFLHALESATPGLSPREIIEQSSCFILKGGMVATYNDEISCKGPSGLGEEFEGAVRADKLLTMLRKLPEEELTLTQENGELTILGKGRKVDLAMESEILLPVDSVDKPGKWRKLPTEFSEAINMVQSCASADQSTFALTCVHVHQNWVEAFDGFQACRWKLETGVAEPYLVRAASVKHITSLGMSEISESKNWLHFKNASGLVISIRRDLSEYPQDVGKSIRKLDDGTYGNAVQLPKGMAEEADRAAEFSSENSDANYLIVELRPGKVRIKGVGVTGRYLAGKKLNWSGPEIQFVIAPTLLSKIVTDHSESYISPGRLLVSGGNWKYAAYLGPVAGKEEVVEGEAE